MFEYLCERIIPGCSHEDRDKSEEELLRRVDNHLREHHNLDHPDDRVTVALRETGIQFIRPA